MAKNRKSKRKSPSSKRRVDGDTIVSDDQKTSAKAPGKKIASKPAGTPVMNGSNDDREQPLNPKSGAESGKRPNLVPVTAIGASAGGLEPIEQFFDAMPADSGCAFVIIQHLSPDFRSLMDELLARHSSMQIYRITNGMEIMPNSIYLNPPRSVMTIEGNRLLVEEITAKNTVYLPIDIFFQSLAEDRGDSAIGLVLSGTGSDGTRGSQNIQAAGGQILVQDPVTTRFDGMPRSVLSDGYSTLVAAPALLAESVQRLLNNESLEGLDINERQPITDPLSDVLSMLKHSHGTDFLQYKEATIHRRIERRAQMRGLTDIDDYRDLLSVDGHELEELYADLLIEVTEFFRDQAAFEVLQKTVLPQLTEDLKDGGSLRVWVPGCASGEEAYSIAILLQEQARVKGIFLHLKIMATDIHIRSMNQASSGIYNDVALKNMPPDLIDRYFDCADGQAQIKPNLRNMVFFSTHDVTRDPPFTRIDLISCRNLLIYLKEDAQEKVMNLLHFSLRKGGFLFLGPSEHIGAIAHEFDSVNEKWRIYKKRRDVKLLASESIFQRTDLMSSVARASKTPRTVTNNSPGYSDDTIPFKRAHRAALESIVARYAPPGFLLSEDGVVVHIFGNAGELIPLQSGTFSKRIVDLIQPELKVIVTAALDHGRSTDFKSFQRAAYIRNNGGGAISYEVSLFPMEMPGEALRFQLLSIEKIETPEGANAAIADISEKEMEAFDSSQVLQQRITLLEHNLQSSEESLQSTIEELETSNEELQSTNEELMSTNEELQSTNEELHSVNEELYTVSAEHQRKNEELTERDTDIDVLLQSSKIGTIHLDDKLYLRRYTNNARSVFNILPQDVGRPINHITIRAIEQDVLDLVYRTNKNHETHETQVAVDDEVFLLRIMPYREQENQPSGVLITVIDITDVELVRFQLAELGHQYEDVLRNTDSFFVRWEADTNTILDCNDVYAQRWGSKAKDLIGQDIVNLREPKYREAFVESLESHLPNKAQTDIFTEKIADGSVRTARIFTRALSADGVKIDSYDSHGFDCTEEYNYTAALDRLFAIFSDESLDFEGKLRHVLDVGLGYYDLDTAIVSMILGETYEIKCINSNQPNPSKVGTVMKLSDTFCGEFIEDKSFMAIDDVSASDLSGLPCHEKTGIESFVGAFIHTASGPYGTVSFSSKNKRGHDFSVQDENFSLLIGSWIGFLVGNQEQIEFMVNQNEYYQSLFESVPAMMFLCDADGLILSVSNRLASKFNIQPDQLPGKNCNNYFDIDDRTGLKAALASGTAQRLPLTFTLPDSSTMEIELNSSIKTVGTLQGVRMVVLTDVSERNRAFKNIEEQNRRLETANENLNQFAFIASHDLQEPLRKIQQFSSFLEEDLQDSLDTETRYHLDVIVNASVRMSTLIHDLLRFSGASQVEIQKKPISLDELMKEVRGELELLIEESKAELIIGDLPTVEGDESMLRQLFVNLINNSIKYRAISRPLKITVRAVGDSLQDGIYIADNGIGFDMEFSKKIFEPFNRLHSSKDFKGSGIGLAICGTVCDKHGWRLSANSEVDVGSTFSIDFNRQ